jgi:rare lipoprotein A
MQRPPLLLALLLAFTMASEPAPPVDAPTPAAPATVPIDTTFALFSLVATADLAADTPAEDAIAPEATPPLTPWQMTSGTCDTSWYGKNDGTVGRLTASGEPFDDTLMTAAMWSVPLGTMMHVTNPATGKSIVVRINDRGPAKRLDRCIDLSHAAFSAIGNPDHGHMPIVLEAA